MSKKDKSNPLADLEARVAALEAHNGWTPGEATPEDGKTDDKTDDNQDGRNERTDDGSDRS